MTEDDIRAWWNATAIILTLEDNWREGRRKPEGSAISDLAYENGLRFLHKLLNDNTPEGLEERHGR